MYSSVVQRAAIERFLYPPGTLVIPGQFCYQRSRALHLIGGSDSCPTKDWNHSDGGHPLSAKLIKRFGRICGFVKKTASPSTANRSKAQESNKEDGEYDGVRIKFQAELDGPRIPMQIDVGHGDAESSRERVLHFQPIHIARDGAIT
jgi:hypothetical protein